MATAKGLRDVFGRMGFNDQEIVALSGRLLLLLPTLLLVNSTAISRNHRDYLILLHILIVILPPAIRCSRFGSLSRVG